MTRTSGRAAALLALHTALLTGCSAPTVEHKIVVFAASSLTEAFTEISGAFQATHPDTDLVFNFAGSSELVGQINEGAPADMFVSADDATMSRLTEAGMNASDPVAIARNTLAIIVESGNPRGIDDLADLASGELVVVLCAVEVPCGNGAAKVLANAGVSLTPKSYENNAKSVVAKVSEGEADAGIVFVTDVHAAADAAAGVGIPADVNVLSNYLVAISKEARNAAGAQAFVDFVLSEQGQAILAKHGFLAP